MNIHSHIPAADTVYNLTLPELRADSYPDSEQLLSVGLHPWWITPQWEDDFRAVQRWASNPQVLFIGETGLDHLKGPDQKWQELVFRKHAELAESVGKPLIIHCVKAMQELIALKKELAPRQLWIYHGFRGKPQQLQQLILAGFHVSFGALFNPESLRACPPHLRHAESDDSPIPFQEILQLQQQIIG